MAEYALKGGKYIEEASNTINDAVNLWGSANTAVYGAWLEYDALSHHGEKARIEYESIREDARAALLQAQNGLIAVRDALSEVATGYKKAEKDSDDKIRPIRPELDGPR